MDSHPRSDLLWCWCWIRKRDCALVLDGGSPSPTQRGGEHPIPALRHGGDLDRQPRELRHRDDPPERVEDLARGSRVPGGGAVHRVPRDQRDPGEPDRAGEAGGRESGAEEDKGSGERGGGVRDDRGGVRAGPAGEEAVQEADEEGEHAAADHRRDDAGFPADDGDKRHHVLRAGAVPDNGLQDQRLPPLLRHHRLGQRLQHLRLHLLRRSDRPEKAPPRGLLPDAHFSGGDRSDSRNTLVRDRNPK
ncbi:unnamed protein product [Cuscuta epithymum]|uniref:Uncharacterized protein n=1 Tax=Cuscuta epithymum TaxID=186058 RepID=A0AAV0GE38_9ASTE|nr:unnamed protein product [Cuscuta epithymum]